MADIQATVAVVNLDTSSSGIGCVGADAMILRISRFPQSALTRGSQRALIRRCEEWALLLQWAPAMHSYRPGTSTTNDHCALSARHGNQENNRADDPDDDFVQYAVLAVGDLTVAVTRAALKAITHLGCVVTSKSTSRWMLGLCEVNHGWLPLVAVSALFALEPKNSSTLAVVEGVGGVRIGLLVDSVIGFRDVFATELCPDEINKSDWVVGVTRDQLLLLDLNRIFEHPAISPEAVRGYFFFGG